MSNSADIEAKKSSSFQLQYMSSYATIIVNKYLKFSTNMNTVYMCHTWGSTAVKCYLYGNEFESLRSFLQAADSRNYVLS